MSKRASKFGARVDTDALPRRKDIRKWKPIENRAIKKKKKKIGPLRLGEREGEGGREINLCASTSVCIIQGRHEKGLSRVKDSPFSYLEVAKGRGASKTIERRITRDKRSSEYCSSRVWERISELLDGGSSQEGHCHEEAMDTWTASGGSTSEWGCHC